MVPDGARAATARMARIVSSSTMSGKKARTDRRDMIASSTIAASSAIRLFFSSMGRPFTHGWTRQPDSRNDHPQTQITNWSSTGRPTRRSSARLCINRQNRASKSCMA
ncbi:hypothetical protein MPLB_1250017 [Mesorhizobium sp. ORS 3324]|nr:hypothetical protein MPLB_1250017 [Mesorhizobium sp. ORS 3324]